MYTDTYLGCQRGLPMWVMSLQMFYKAARVEYHPVGVVGAIVPWNYPFHNVFNPLTAALFAGNGLVIKVGILKLSLLMTSDAHHPWSKCARMLPCWIRRCLNTRPGPHSTMAASSLPPFRL